MKMYPTPRTDAEEKRQRDLYTQEMEGGRAKRLSAAKSRLTEIDARIVVETLATLLMPEASIFWDEAERQVELIGSRFEVIVRESPNAPVLPRREGGAE